MGSWEIQLKKRGKWITAAVGFSTRLLAERWLISKRISPQNARLISPSGVVYNYES